MKGAPTSQPIFAIFEGGGAKGIAHVGAYAAADEMGLELVGVAGASAGSIVAALIAVGFAPDEIFDPTVRTRNVFSTYGLSPVQLLGAREWRTFRRLKRRVVWLVGSGFLACVATLAALLGGSLPQARVGAAACAVAALLLAIRAGTLLQQRGIFDPARFAEAFNRILHDRVVAAHAAEQSTMEIPGKIRFRDIDPQRISTFCRLKVVATDVSGQQLRLFDHRTPDVVVAEAVAASIAIPGVFKPAAIPSYEAVAGPRLYADGGLVSNLPVWCFAEEKAAIERRTPNNAAVPIVAFTLGDSATMATERVMSSVQYAEHVLRAGIFGGQTVVQDFVSDLLAIRLPTRLGVLAFDADWNIAKAAYLAGRKRASSRLRRNLVSEPREWELLLAAISADVRREIEAKLQSGGIHLRAGVFEPIRPLRGHAAPAYITAYRVTHSYNMLHDADDRLTLDAACPGVPEAFEKRSVALLFAADSAHKAVMSKYEKALVRRTMKSAICFPIFADAGAWSLPAAQRNQPLGVISFDSDIDIITCLKGNETVLESIAEATIALSALLNERDETQYE